AELALIELGPQAAPAIGELAEMLNDPGARESAMRAFVVLSGIHAGQLLPPVLSGSMGTRFGWGMTALPPDRLRYPRSRTQLTCSRVQLLLTNADWNVRREATNALRKIDPTQVKGKTGGNGDERRQKNG